MKHPVAVDAYFNVKLPNGKSYFAVMTNGEKYWLVSRPLYGKVDNKVFDSRESLIAYYRSCLEEGAVLEIHSYDT